MEIKEFIAEMVNNLDTKYFNLLKNRLSGEYLTFYFVEEEKISTEVFGEKLADYFEKIEIKTGKFTSK